MQNFVSWMFAGLVLTLSATWVLRPQDARTAPDVEGVDVARDVVVLAWAEPEPTPPADLGPQRDWCEPVEALGCEKGSTCPPTSDGRERVCVRQWYSKRDTSHICAVKFPSRAEQRWRSDRLRVLVDEICAPRRACNPSALHAYLSTLILRESSWRPYKVHRLNEDVAANDRSYRRLSSRYADNPAADEPWRWQGYGYFGQNAAVWLHLWDQDAMPETLCGEVESVLVHLRAARHRWHVLEQGVECNGIEHHGTASDGGPSWYDVSLVNSGSEACPGERGKPAKVREGFERRAKSRGLDPYGRVSLASLGQPVSPKDQATFAVRMRAKMDAAYPEP